MTYSYVLNIEADEKNTGQQYTCSESRRSLFKWFCVDSYSNIIYFLFDWLQEFNIYNWAFSEKSIHYPFIRYNVLCVEPLLIFLSKIFHNCFRNIFLKIETKSQLYGWINRGASMDEHETLIKLNWIIYSLHVHGLNYFCCSCLYYILCIPQILFLKKNFSIIFITVLNKNFK